MDFPSNVDDMAAAGKLSRLSSYSDDQSLESSCHNLWRQRSILPSPDYSDSSESLENILSRFSSSSLTANNDEHTTYDFYSLDNDPQFNFEGFVLGIKAEDTIVLDAGMDGTFKTLEGSNSPILATNTILEEPVEGFSRDGKIPGSNSRKRKTSDMLRTVCEV